MLPTPPPRRRRKDARPGEILAAALALFGERGFSATRLDDVAARAGVSKGTVYLYYPTKEDLFRAVLRQGLIPNLEAMEVELATHQGSTAELLGLIGRRLLALMDTNLTVIPKLVLAEAGNFPALAQFYADEVVKRAMALLAGILRRGMDRGELRTIDPQDAIPSIMAPFLMMALWKHSLGQHTDLALDPEAVVAAHLQVLLHGLEKRP